MRIEEMIAVRAGAAQTMRALLAIGGWQAWQMPDVTVTRTAAHPMLGPGDRFRLEGLAGVRFDYVVEGVSDREVVFAFDGPWRGTERWSFIPDGAETLVRRTYDVEGASPLAALAWRAGGRAVVSAHFKLELGRFRSVVEREPGVRAEIEAPRGAVAEPGEARARGAASEPPEPPFPVDDG
jgi:hypothetical protein